MPRLEVPAEPSLTPTESLARSPQRIALAAALAVVAVVAIGLAWSRLGSRPDVARREVPTAPSEQSPPSEAESSTPTPPAATSAPKPSTTDTEKAEEKVEKAETKTKEVAEPPTPPSGKISVTVKVRPEGARIYHRGKEPGKLPLVVELEPGEKRT